MVQETFLSNWIVVEYILPFLLIFFIIFALLEKTKIFGEDKKQLNAFISFVIALIFVVAVAPKTIVSNLVWFLTVSIIVIFVGLLLWSFVSGEDAALTEKTAKIIVGILIAIALFIAVLWATGIKYNFFNFWKTQNFGGSTLWVNLLFILIIAAAIAFAIKSGGE